MLYFELSNHNFPYSARPCYRALGSRAYAGKVLYMMWNVKSTDPALPESHSSWEIRRKDVEGEMKTSITRCNDIWARDGYMKKCRKRRLRCLGRHRGKGPERELMSYDGESWLGCRNEWGSSAGADMGRRHQQMDCSVLDSRWQSNTYNTISRKGIRKNLEGCISNYKE